ncbi:MAG: gluconate 2-dehydrogenase subunit 3 family protein [Saprospiraceae bacterium]
MNRRSTLKTLASATGALLVLPGWAKSWNKDSMRFYISSFTQDQQETLSALVDTIIPAGDMIGGRSVGVDVFLQKLFDKCYEKEVQDNVKKQLAALETAAQTQFNTSFGACSQLQRETLFLAFSNSTIKEEKDFFKLLKSETIRGFSTSEEVMVKYHKFKIAPGHYYGCVDVNA